MSYQLERSFAIWWAVWLAYLLACAFFGLPVLYSRIAFGLFLPMEAWAWFRRSGGLGDTLSEVVQNIETLAPEGVRWWQSWRIVPVGLSCLISWQAAWTVGYWREPWDHWPAGVIVGCTVLLWTIYHFLDTERYG